ncbi:MAG: putative multidrug export ATP-binding/permease protein [candidate division WS2 bacterium]|uniref:Multidrug export ATP-binding/permease protein n=1 Tax=Psychracetigena formicireducens TaxID=2986056 RepID=A0A9E2F7Y2_PSYF1|nr:putative multidrug export ATP-binding/permease protein [Candidatus Psychracetigena formicireducens]
MIKYKSFFACMLLIVLLGGIAALATPVLINIWNSDSIGFTSSRVFVLLAVLIGATLIQLFFVYMRERFAATYNQLNMEKQLDVFYNLRYDYLNEQGPTNILERIVQGINNTYEFMTGDFIKIWSSLLIIIVVLAIVATNNVMLAGILLIMVPVNYFGYKLLNKELAKRTQRAQKMMGQGFQTMLSVLSQTDYLKQIDNYNSVRKFLHPEIGAIYKTIASVNVLAQTASTILSSLNHIVQTMVMVVIVFSFIRESSSPYILILYPILLPLYFSNISMITNANLSKTKMQTSDQFFQELHDNIEADGSFELERVKKIAFNIDELNVGNTKIKCKIHQEFKLGDVVWIQGNSGVGKSSLMKLLPKLRTSNDVLINGVVLSSIKNSSLRGDVDYLSQQIPIIKGTLRDNLFFGLQWSEEMESKLQRTTLLKQLLETKSMDTMIEENGTNLSGGEKQKIAALRAFNSSASVLILDEIASSIDNETATDIYYTLLANSQDRITFIISHDNLPESFATRIVKMGENLCDAPTG